MNVLYSGNPDLVSMTLPTSNRRQCQKMGRPDRVVFVKLISCYTFNSIYLYILGNVLSTNILEMCLPQAKW